MDLYQSCRFSKTIISSATTILALLLFSSCHSSVAFSPRPRCLYPFFPRTFSRLQQQEGKNDFETATTTTNAANANGTTQTAHDLVQGVTLKMAFDAHHWAVADAAPIKSERFTSPASLDLVHRLRRASDAVLVGRATVERDNCTLTVRRGVPLLKNNTQPVRVVIDPELRLLQDDSNQHFALFHDGLDTIVYCTNESFNNATLMRMDVDDRTHVQVVPMPSSSFLNGGTTNNNNKCNILSVHEILHDLHHNRGIHHVMVEGGPATAMQFLQSELVDRAVLIRASPSVVFASPVLSHFNATTLVNAGLDLLGSIHHDDGDGGDVVEYWSRRPNLAWPTQDIADWP